jgi:PAS domain S-box-containing protein
MLVPERFRQHHVAYRAGFFGDSKPRPMGVGRDLAGCRSDGSEFPVEIGLNPIDTEAGVMVLASIIDITERQRTSSGSKMRCLKKPYCSTKSTTGSKTICR